MFGGAVMGRPLYIWRIPGGMLRIFICCQLSRPCLP